MNSIAMSNDRPAKLLLITLVAGILFNFPIIILAEDDGFIAGLPSQYFYVFFAWLLIIVITYFVLRSPRKQKNGPDKPNGHH